MNSYKKRYTLPSGDQLSIVSTPHSYGGNEGLFEAAWTIQGQLQEPLGYLTFAHVAEILAEHKLEN